MGFESRGTALTTPREKEPCEHLHVYWNEFFKATARARLVPRLVPRLPTRLAHLTRPHGAGGRRHGVGTLMFEGGIFEGQWARGEATGSGVAPWQSDSGSCFRGGLCKDFPQGSKEA